MSKPRILITDKILELENKHRQEQLDALTWKPVAKAPVSTGLGVIGYSFDLDVLRPKYSYRAQFQDKEKMLEVQIQKANYMRYCCIGRIPGLYVEIKGLIESMLGARIELAPDVTMMSMESMWVMPCNDDLNAIVERGLPSLTAGLFPMVKEFTEYFRDNLPEGFYLSPTGGAESPFAAAASILQGVIPNSMTGRGWFTSFWS